MANEYGTLAALAATLNITTPGMFDTDLTAALSAASRAIDQQCGRRFYGDADANQVRYYLAVNSGYAVIDDLATFTALEQPVGTSWTLGTDFFLEPQNAAADGHPYTGIRTIARPFIFPLSQMTSGWAGFDGRLKVTGKFGWAATPPEITQATTILASRLFKRAREAPFGAMAFGEQAIRLSMIDPDVQSLIGPYALSVLV